MFLLTVTLYFSSTFFKVGYMTTTTETFDTFEQCSQAQRIVESSMKSATKGKYDRIISSCKELK